VDVVDGAQRDSSQATRSLSDSEKSNATLTEVQLRRAWSSDGDAPAAVSDCSSSSTEGNSELFPAAPPRTCSETDPEPAGSQPGVTSTTARRLAYEQFARVMYTNRANLQHTIAVQQRLFQQQLAHPAFHGYINSALGPPPLPPRRREVVGDKSTGELEWVVRRRADGTRYITRRPTTSRHHSRRITSSTDSKKTTGKLGDHGRRKEVKEMSRVMADVVPESQTKEQSQPVHSKSSPAFHNAPVTSLRQASQHQHPILAVITI